MFDFLKGGKAYQTITLARPQATFSFGETVHGTLTVESQNEIKFQEGRIALVCKEEYQYRYESRSTDSDGNTETSEETLWTSEEKPVATVVLLKAGTLRANTKQTFEFDLAIPTNAPPTMSDGRILRLKWLVRATLDRKMASDLNEEVEILVAAKPNQPNTAGEFGYSNESNEAELALALPGHHWAMGATVAGTFIVRPQKNFDVTQVRIQAIRKEFVPRDQGNTFVEEATIKLAGATKLAAGQTLTYPFQITLPTPRPPTGHTAHGEVSWAIKGVLARRLRGDTTVDETIWVYNFLPAQ
ncbi:MAG: sporulation protein [Chloroflexi bacterium]|nr:sporulation protein [Chloroflexota bacterium]